jgi:hypothetical protein
MEIRQNSLTKTAIIREHEVITSLVTPILRPKLCCKEFELGASYADRGTQKAGGQFAKHLLKTIAAARRESWSHFTAGDESWFYLSTDYETTWLQEREDHLRGCIELDGEYVD